MFQQFLDGKKKYSALIITLLVAIVPLFVTEPEAQKTILDYVPSVAAVLAGIIYIITQGSIDKAKTQADGVVAIATVKAANGSASQTTAQAIPPKLPASQPTTIESTPMLNIKLFHERVLNDVAAHYTEVNPATVFYEARDKGSVTTAQNLGQVKDYWDYLVSLAYPMVEYIKEQTEAKTTGLCKGIAAPELLRAQQDLSKILKCRDNVYILANTNIDWRKRLDVNDTLYLTGYWADFLLK